MDKVRQQWNEEGYIIVRGLFSPERSARLLTICNRILACWRVCNPENGKSNPDPNANCMRHLNHPGYFREERDEFIDLMRAVADPAVLNVARTILETEPLFRCTSYFFNPTGTSQDGNWHRDSQFMHPDVEAEKQFIQNGGHIGGGIQMQIALAPSEDIEFVPRSHKRVDTPEEFQIRRAENGRNCRSNHMPGALRIKQEPGDAVLFNAVGLHRGRYHTDKLRRTLMLTYTKPCSAPYDYFTQQPWFLEPGHLDPLDAKTRAFFEKFVAEFQDRWNAEPVNA